MKLFGISLKKHHPQRIRVTVNRKDSRSSHPQSKEQPQEESLMNGGEPYSPKKRSHAPGENTPCKDDPFATPLEEEDEEVPSEQ